MTIIIHLGMTGKFFLINKKNNVRKTSFYYEINKNDEKHNHIIFLLSKNIKLRNSQKSLTSQHRKTVVFFCTPWHQQQSQLQQSQQQQPAQMQAMTQQSAAEVQALRDAVRAQGQALSEAMTKLAEAQKRPHGIVQAWSACSNADMPFM